MVEKSSYCRGGKIDQGSVIVNLANHDMIDDATCCGVNICGEQSNRL